MKKMLIFVLAGLFLGLGGGSFVRGAKERDVILTRMAAEKAVADSLAVLEAAADSTLHGGEGEDPHGTGEDSHAGNTEGSEGSGEAEDGLGQEEATDPSPGASDHQDSSTAAPVGARAEGDHQEAVVTLPPPPGQEPGDEAPEEEGPVRLAKIFAAMQAKDAAAVMENLTNEEVQSILLNMSTRKVAEILGAFSPERAAILSRIVLADRPGSSR